MEGEVSVGTPRDTLSIPPATRDMSSQEVLQEHVSLMDCGQEVQLLAHVSVLLMDLHTIFRNTIRVALEKV